MKSPIWNTTLAAAAFLALFASGCGQQSFEAVHNQLNSDAPGGMTIAPKVDILLAVDNTGSTYEIQSALNSALRGFLSGLQSQDWDFRIAAIPLTGSTSITRVAASKYDANWGSDWVAPYPGAPKTTTLPASMFVKPDNFTVSLASSNSNNGSENGLAQIGTVVNQSSTKQYFTRPDAILAIVVISNGEDTSDGNEVYYPYAPKSEVSSSLITTIRNAKVSALSNSVRLFSVVNTASGRVSGCLGETAWAGKRYVRAAQILGGNSYDICRNQLSSVLSTLKTDLQAIKLDYVKRFVLLSAQPNVATIKVTKHYADGSTAVVPESAGGSSGWKYLGQANVPMISSPIEMDFRTGYAIQLIGEEYKLTGNEFVSIEFLPVGVQSSQ